MHLWKNNTQNNTDLYLTKKEKKGVLSSNEAGINKDAIRFWYVLVLHLTVSCFG